VLQDSGLWRRVVAALAGIRHRKGPKPAWDVSGLCQRVLVSDHRLLIAHALPSSHSQTVSAACHSCHTVLLHPDAIAKVSLVAHGIEQTRHFTE
jgi:hypothetical protein